MRIGTLEYWNTGTLEYRVCRAAPPIIPLFHRNPRRRRLLVGGSLIFPLTDDVPRGAGRRKVSYEA